MDDSEDKIVLKNGLNSTQKGIYNHHDVLKYYPNSCCQNFGVELIEVKEFWKDRLGSALWYEDSAVDMIQTFQSKVDTSKTELEKLCRIKDIQKEVVPIIMQFENTYYDDKIEFIHAIEKLYGKRFKKEFRKDLFYSITHSNRIENFNFLFWGSYQISYPYHDIVYILYEEKGSMYHVLGDQIDGVNPAGWFPKPTSWETLLKDVMFDGYKSNEFTKFFAKLKDDLKLIFSL